MTRPPSRSVISDGLRGCRGSGGYCSQRAPSAIPTRSAPSARALPLTSAAVSLLLKIATMISDGLALRRRLRLRLAAELLLRLHEGLQLAANHAAIAVWSYPPDIPAI